MTDQPRMTDNRGRFPRGLLTSAPAPRTIAEVKTGRTILAIDPGKTDGVAIYRRGDFTAGPCYLPPDDPPPPRWRWWRDPLVIGAVIGLAVVVAIFFSVIP